MRNEAETVLLRRSTPEGNARKFMFARKGTTETLVFRPRNRQAILHERQRLKMARSAHAYVRGSTVQFYQWLNSKAGKTRTEGPAGMDLWRLPPRKSGAGGERERACPVSHSGFRSNCNRQSSPRFNPPGAVPGNCHPRLGSAWRNHRDGA
jgi:hypothetical protein